MTTTNTQEDELERAITSIFVTIDNYGTAQEAREDIRKLISTQREQARQEGVKATLSSLEGFIGAIPPLEDVARYGDHLRGRYDTKIEIKEFINSKRATLKGDK